MALQDHKGKLLATVGVACCAVLFKVVPQFEGEVLKGYKDPIGIVTACDGNTRDAVLGKTYTREECQQLLARDLLDKAEPVLKCAPVLKDHPNQLAASISFAFNEGAHAFCDVSPIARRFQAGDFAGACRAFNQSDDGRPRWVTAGGRVLPGLVARRAAERKLCESLS